MTAPIRPTQTLADALRAQLTALSATEPAARAQTPAAKSTQTLRKTRDDSTPHGLPAALLRRTAALDVTDPDRRRKAMRLFLESALCAEWGDGLVNDPSFQRMVDDVLAQMARDASLALLMQQAADQLLTRAD